MPTDAYTHPFPEEGGLVLCEECAPPSSTLWTHSDLQTNWTDPISRTNPRYCDNCGEPVVAHDTP
jgi:hypothetical protein